MSAAFQADPLHQRPRRRSTARPARPGKAADAFAAAATAAPQPAGQQGSVFASLVSGGARKRGCAEPLPAPVSETAVDAPLSALGFGPSMLIRLRQLGVESTAALARADAETLRAELGEISRLVNVEAWILRARQAAGLQG